MLQEKEERERAAERKTEGSKGETEEGEGSLKMTTAP